MDYLDMTLLNDMETHERRSVDYSFGLLREYSVSREELVMGFSLSASASRKSSIDITTFVSKEDASKESPVNFVFEDYDSEVPSFELTPSVVSTLCGGVSVMGDVCGDVSGVYSGVCSGVMPCASGVVPCANGVMPCASIAFTNTLPSTNTLPFTNALPTVCPDTLPTVNNPVPTLSTSQPIDTLLRERLEGLKKEECRKRRQKRREILRIKRQKGLVSFDCPVRYRQRSEQANQRLRSSGRFVSELQYIDA